MLYRIYMGGLAGHIAAGTAAGMVGGYSQASRDPTGIVGAPRCVAVGLTTAAAGVGGAIVGGCVGSVWPVAWGSAAVHAALDCLE